jgi:hypothetical protein
LMQVPIFLDEVFEILTVIHSSSLPFPYCYGRLSIQTGSWSGAWGVAAEK